jgi:hypothetical protein
VLNALLTAKDSSLPLNRVTPGISKLESPPSCAVGLDAPLAVEVVPLLADPVAADPLACSAELWPLAELAVPDAELEGVPLCCVVALGHAGQLGEGRWLARLITFSKTNDAMSKIRERTAIPFTSFSLNPTPPA